MCIVRDYGVGLLPVKKFRPEAPMNRSHSTDAIVLKNTRIGEIHKGVVMLTSDEGLVNAIAHGAYSQKGKLRGTTNLFCQ